MSVDIVKHSNWVEVILNRPEKKNAMTAEMWQSLFDLVESIKNDGKTKLLILKSSSECFSAGADIEELAKYINDKDWHIANNELVRSTQLALEKLPIPTLAIINGACVGGGCGLALACDYRIASTNSFFCLTPGSLGLIYSVDDTRRLVNQIGFSRAKQMLMFAERVDARTGLSWQLVQEVVDADSLAIRQDKIKEKMFSLSSVSIAGLKHVISYLAGHSDNDIQFLHQLFNQAFESKDFIQRSKRFLREK